MISTTTIYSHPDGHEITVGNGLLTAVTSEGTAVSIPVGALGLADLGRALTHHAALPTAQDDAKHAGAALACDLVHDIAQLHGHFHPTAVRAVRRVLSSLAKQDHLDHAIGGFAGMLTHTLERGIAASSAIAAGIGK